MVWVLSIERGTVYISIRMRFQATINSLHIDGADAMEVEFGGKFGTAWDL